MTQMKKHVLDESKKCKDKVFTNMICLTYYNTVAYTKYCTNSTPNNPNFLCRIFYSDNRFVKRKSLHYLVENVKSLYKPTRYISV